MMNLNQANEGKRKFIFPLKQSTHKLDEFRKHKPEKSIELQPWKPKVTEDVVEQRLKPHRKAFEKGQMSEKIFSMIKDMYSVEELFRLRRDPGERIVGFMGSARTKTDDPDYAEFRGLASNLARDGFSILTGAGPGLMEAASYGGKDAGAKVYGIRIRVPYEQHTNDAVDADKLVYCDNFTPRFQGLVYNSDAIVVGRGGLGTLEELTYAITEMQTGKMPLKPLVLLGSQYQAYLDIMDKMIEKGTVSANDKHLVDLVKTPEEAEKIVKQFYNHLNSISICKDSRLIIHLNKPIDPEFVRILPSKDELTDAFKADLKNTNGIPRCSIQNGSKTSVLILNANIRNIGVVKEVIDLINLQPVNDGKIVPCDHFWHDIYKKLVAARVLINSNEGNLPEEDVPTPDKIKDSHGPDVWRKYASIFTHLKIRRD